MNIALFGDAYYPVKNGVATHMRELKKGLEANGHNVFIVSVRVPSFIEHDKNILRLPSFPIGMGTDQRIALVNQKKVLKFIQENNIDIIHTHSEFVVGKAGIKVGRKLYIPVVHTLHTLWEEYSHYLHKVTLLPDPSLKKYIRNYLIKYLTKVDFVVCPSNKSYSYLKSILPTAKSQVLHNAMNKDLIESALPTALEAVEMRKELGLNVEDKVLIFVGRIGKEKRVKELVTNLLPLLQQKAVKLILVGEGPDLNFLKEFSTENEVSESIIFTGFVPWEKVIKLYSISDIFISVSKSEVHPMTALEAANCGLPIIAPQDDAFSGVVENGRNGFLISQDADLLVKVVALLGDEKKKKEFSDASKIAAGKFDVNGQVKKIIEIYNSVRNISQS